MANKTGVFKVIRVIILVLVILFAAPVLINGALVTSETVSYDGVYYPSVVFAIAIASLTLLTVPAMIALSISRKGAFPSMIVVELCYVCLLWILWLAVGGTIANLPSDNLDYCRALSVGSSCWLIYDTVIQVMAASSFLNFILLMVLNIYLLSLAIVQANRGNAIWTSGVTDVDYGAPAASKVAYDSPGGSATSLAQHPQLVPTPQPQYSRPVLAPQQMYSPQQYMYTTQPQPHGPPMSAQV